VEWLKPRDIAAALRPPISTGTVLNWIYAGYIPPKYVIRNPGHRGRRLVHRDAVEYLQRLRTAA